MDKLEEYRNEHFNSICNKHKVFKGCVMSAELEKIEEEIYNMEVREEDVWVISFPKSGKL